MGKNDLITVINIFYKLATEMVYGPYDTGNQGRKFVIIKKDDGSSRTVSYPKYLMEKYLGRELHPDQESVDHWDSNINNNDISNLRVVPRDQHSADDTRRVKLIKCKCILCGKDFERSPRLLRDKAKKGKLGPFCDRICAGKFSRMLQLKLIDKLDAPKQQPVESEYYKKKYVSASANNFLDFFVDYFCDFSNE